jgi:hypothetical protein
MTPNPTTAIDKLSDPRFSPWSANSHGAGGLVGQARSPVHPDQNGMMSEDLGQMQSAG